MNNLNFKYEINKYKNALSSTSKSVNDYVNLILLYWTIAFDHGLELYVISTNDFSQNEVLEFPGYVKTLFKESLEIHPDNEEILFWKIYLTELASNSYCTNRAKIEALINNDFLLPYFYLHIQCGITNEKALFQLKQELLLSDYSYRNQYLLSFL